MRDRLLTVCFLFLCARLLAYLRSNSRRDVASGILLIRSAVKTLETAVSNGFSTELKLQQVDALKGILAELQSAQASLSE